MHNVSIHYETEAAAPLRSNVSFFFPSPFSPPFRSRAYLRMQLLSRFTFDVPRCRIFPDVCIATARKSLQLVCVADQRGKRFVVRLVAKVYRALRTLLLGLKWTFGACEIVLTTGCGKTREEKEAVI